MYNDKRFLTVFRVILLITLIESVLYLLADYAEAGLRLKAQRYRWLSLVQILDIVGLWGGIAYWLKKYLAALVAVLLTMGTTLIRVQVLPPDISFGVLNYSIAKTFLDFIFCLVPALVFGWMVFRDKRAWAMLSLGVLWVGVSFYNGQAISQFLGQLLGNRYYFTLSVDLGNGSTRDFYYLNSFFKSLTLPILFLGYSFVLDGLRNNINYLKGRSIDLSHSLSKSWATAIYLIFWLSILFLTFNAVQYTGRISWYYELMLRLCMLFTVYLLSLAYRNFLTTYLISRNKSPNMLYFWWLFPFTSIISWLLSLAFLGKRIPLKERIQLFKQQQEKSDNNRPLKVLIIILAIMLALYNFSSLNNRLPSIKIVSVIASSLISLGLVIWYFNHPSGVWPILIIAVIQVSIMSYVASPRGSTSVSPNFVYSLSNALLLFPLFHLYHLKNVAELPPEEVVTEEATTNEKQ